MNCEKQSVMMTFAYGGLSDMDIEMLNDKALKLFEDSDRQSDEQEAIL